MNNTVYKKKRTIVWDRRRMVNSCMRSGSGRTRRMVTHEEMKNRLRHVGSSIK
jgi:hypothetical protein